jgi:hypothetical protein
VQSQASVGEALEFIGAFRVADRFLYVASTGERNSGRTGFAGLSCRWAE